MGDNWKADFEEYSRNPIINKIRYWIYKKFFLENITDKKSKILDVGCGTGDFMLYLKRQGYKNIYGIEPLTSLYRKNKNLNIKKDSMFDIHYKNNSFDYIYVFNVFHHLKSTEEYKIGMKEITRILKPEGKLLIIEPCNYLLYASIFFIAKILKQVSKAINALYKVLKFEWIDISLFLKNYKIFRDLILNMNYKIIKERKVFHQWILFAEVR